LLLPIVSTKHYWCYWHRCDNMFSSFLWHIAYCYQNHTKLNLLCNVIVTCRGRFPLHEVHHSDTKLVWSHCAVLLNGDWIRLPFYSTVNVIKTGMCFVLCMKKCTEFWLEYVKGKDTIWKTQAYHVNGRQILKWVSEKWEGVDWIDFAQPWSLGFVNPVTALKFL